MKPLRLSRALSIVLAVALLSIALSVTPAGASTTTWMTSQIKAIWAKLNPLVTRVASHTTQINTLKTRVDTLSGTGFWPVQEISAGINYKARALPADGWSFDIDLLATPVGPQGVSAADAPTECVAKITFDGRTFWQYSPSFSLTGSNTGIAARPSSRTPVTIEYWMERYGIRRHGTLVLADWWWV